MYLNNDAVFSIAQANQNFSQIAKAVENNGEAVVFENEKAKYLIVDIESNEYILDLSDDEKIEIVAKRILNRFLPAFKELAK